MASDETPSASTSESPSPERIDTFLDRTVQRLVDFNAKVLERDLKELRWRQVKFLFWGIFSLTISVAYILGWVNWKNVGKIKGDYVAVVNINGEIGAGKDASIDSVVPALVQAFKDKHAKGVVIKVNSPGGAPVEASTIHDEIIRLKKKYHKKVVVVGTDYITSGAYMISVAADKIYVNPNSIVGSIGVIYATFGFDKIMKRIGIARRVHTAGTHKAVGDMFSPEDPSAIKGIDVMLKEIHKHFIAMVVDGRGARLKPGKTDLFEGDAWSGDDALKYGLVDGLKDYNEVLADEFGVDQGKVYGGESMWSGVFRRFGMDWLADLTTAATAPAGTFQ